MPILLYFVSSERQKWNIIKDLKGSGGSCSNLPIPLVTSALPGGASKKPFGNIHDLAYNKITPKTVTCQPDPELAQSAQPHDISGDKMQLILDCLTIGRTALCAGIAARRISSGTARLNSIRSMKMQSLMARENPPAKWFAKAKYMHMTSIRSHLTR